VKEAAESYDAVAFQAGIGSEDHIGRAGLWFNEKDFGNVADSFVEMLPLLCCPDTRRSVNVTSHPRIDDVTYVVEPRRTQ